MCLVSSALYFKDVVAIMNLYELNLCKINYGEHLQIQLKLSEHYTDASVGHKQLAFSSSMVDIAVTPWIHSLFDSNPSRA